MAAENTVDVVDRAYLRETSFAHMARMTTEAKTRDTIKWIAEHVR